MVELATTTGTVGQQIRALIARETHLRNFNRYQLAAEDFYRARSMAEQSGDTDEVRLIAMTAFAHMLIFLGRFSEGNAILVEAEALAADAGLEGREADALVLRAWLESHAGRYGEQVRLAERVVEIFRRLGDTSRLANALRVLGDGLSHSADLPRALEVFEESRALYARRGEDHLVGQLDSQTSYVVYHLGDVARARELASSALAMGRRYADQWAIAMCTTILGHFALATGDVPAAREHLAEGAQAFERIGNPLYLTWNLEGRAVLASVDGDMDRAARLLTDAGEGRARLESKLPPIDESMLSRARDAVRRHTP